MLVLVKGKISRTLARLQNLRSRYSKMYSLIALYNII